MSSAHMIHVSDLGKAFARTRILDGMDLSVPAGERVALVGANGAGKTTLIRCLLGEYTFDGEIRIGGHSPREKRKEVLSGTGFVPQIPPPLRMPVGQLLRFASELCGADLARMESVAGRLGLDVKAIRRQPFTKLSGGQKQKLLIAVALGRDTSFLVMDEPAANLDPEARRAFFDLLREQSEGTTMLISSHRLDEVAALVERVVELDHGRVVLDDRVADTRGLSSQMRCRLVLRRPEAVVARTLRDWSFEADTSECIFEGRVANADRLRFFGLLSRYSGLFTELSLDEEESEKSSG